MSSGSLAWLGVPTADCQMSSIGNKKPSRSPQSAADLRVGMGRESMAVVMSASGRLRKSSRGTAMCKPHAFMATTE